jgi:asparaginyl-tRNA synthetase
MIEPELAFADLEDDMNCAEDYVRFCIRHLLEHCMEDMEFITKMIDKDALARCRQVVETPFKRISYVATPTLGRVVQVLGKGRGGEEAGRSSRPPSSASRIWQHRVLQAVPHTSRRYTEAIQLLEEHIAKGKVFENPVSWGIDLASEHERYITEEIFKQPTIVYNYPKDIKVRIGTRPPVSHSSFACLFYSP